MQNLKLKSVALLAASFCAAAAGLAAEVTPAMALQAVGRWRRTRDALSTSLGRTPRAARVCTVGKAKFNVVTLEGGGFVVTSAETADRPILAFCEGDDLDEDPRNPLYALLARDMSRAVEAREKRAAAKLARARLASVALPGTPSVEEAAAEEATAVNEREWGELLSEAPVATLQASTISDVRVGPLVQSKWNQSTKGGTSSSTKVYNYYTPKNYVCGCVATAASQIMRFFQWPKSTSYIQPFTNPHCKVDGTLTTLTAQGGYYDWSKMPLTPKSMTSITSEQCQMIGKLTSDVGIAVAMRYASGGSSSGTSIAGTAFTKFFGYSQAVAAIWSKDELTTASSEWTRRIFLTNFDAGLPVQIGMTKSDGSGGHSIVADGYGYSGSSLYYHLNYGWSGTTDGWYNPPALGDGYTIIDDIVYNIYTNQPASKVIVSGRVLSNTGVAAAGLTVTAKRGGYSPTTVTTRTNAKGIFALYVDASTAYSITAESNDGLYSATASATTKAIKGIQNVIEGGMPTGSYWTGNKNAEPCNVHVGDMKLTMTGATASVGSTLFATLQQACNAAGNGSTVTLLRDVTESVTVQAGCLIDFGSHTVTGAILGQCNTLGQTLTLRNGTIKGGNPCVCGSAFGGSYPRAAVRFENMTVAGSIRSDNHPLVFAGGTYSGAITCGTQPCTFADGIFTGTITSGSGLCTIAAGKYRTLAKGATKFAVNGGRFASSFASISTIPQDHVWKNDGGDAAYPWSVTFNPVAAVGETGYQTLQAACQAGASGGTVTLLRNTAEATVTVETPCTIDFGGHTLDGTLVCNTTKNVKTTIQNGTVPRVECSNVGTVVLDGMTVQMIEASGSGSVELVSGSADTFTRTTGIGLLTVVGCTLGTVTLAAGRLAFDAGSASVLTSSSAMICSVRGGEIGMFALSGMGRLTIGGGTVANLVVTESGNIRITGGRIGAMTAETTTTCKIIAGCFGEKVTANVSLPEDSIWAETSGDADFPWQLALGRVMMPTAGGSVKVAVSAAWLAANVAASLHGSAEAIQAALGTIEANGLARWQNESMGLAPSGTLMAEMNPAAQEQATLCVEGNLSAPVETHGLTRAYVVDKVDGAGSILEAGTVVAAHPKVSLAGVDSGLYKLNVVLSDGTTSVKVPAANTLGVLCCTNTEEAVVVSVPWKGKTGDLAVSEILRPCDLTPGDHILSYNRRLACFEMWTLAADGSWAANFTVTAANLAAKGPTIAAEAATSKVARGTSVWVMRAHPARPFYLCGFCE